MAERLCTSLHFSDVATKSFSCGHRFLGDYFGGGGAAAPSLGPPAGVGSSPHQTTNARGSGSQSEIPHLPGSGGLGLLASSLGDGVAGSGCEALGSGPSLAVAGASPGLTTIPLPLALTASLPIQGLLCSSACLV